MSHSRQPIVAAATSENCGLGVSRVRRRLACVASASALLAGIAAISPAWSQATLPAASAAAGDQSRPEEVIVTAQKRTEVAQKTPLMLSVLSSRDLRRNQVTSVADLQGVTPALSVSNNGITQYVNIRGVGLGVSAPGVPNGVAYFVDGLFLLDAPLYQDDPYFDLARVEVLRGPQGTLVGEGSTGGAIYIVSQKPQLGRYGGNLEQSFGNYGHYRTEGAVNVPIGQNWAVRVAFEEESRDSFFTLVPPPTTAFGTDPKTPGNLFRLAGRATIEGNLADNLELTIRSEFQHRSSGGTTGKPIPGDPVDTLFLPASPAAPFQLSYNFPTRDESVETENSIEFNWHITPDLSLRSLTGITTGSRHFAEDTDGSYAPGGTRVSDIREHNYSQEFNLVSNAPGRFKWVLGMFELFQSLGGVNYIDSMVPPSSPALPSTTIANGHFSTNSLGIFGQASYDITPRVQLVFGLRQSMDNTRDLPGGFTDQNGHTHFSQGAEINHALTGKVTLNYRITPDELLFGTVSRGYKAGGFNDATSKFSPEYVWDYEAGLKSAFVGGHLLTQLGGFYYDYSSIQVPVYNTTLAFNNVGNGGAAQVYGLEAQFTGKFGDLSVDGNAGYTQTKFGSAYLIDSRSLPFQGTFPLCGFGPGPCTFNFQPYLANLQGKPLPFAPAWTAHLGGEYTFHVPGGTLVPHLSLNYVGHQFATTFAAPEDLIKARFLMDALVTYQYGNHWRVQLYGTNLLDRTYIAGKFNDLQYYGAPREYGVRLAYTF